MKPSEYLLQFYLAYQIWLDCGAPQPEVKGYSLYFDRRFGLCTNLANYGVRKEWSSGVHIAVGEELRQQFRDAHLDCSNPFNSTIRYGEEASNAQCHLNPARIKWVNEHIS